MNFILILNTGDLAARGDTSDILQTPKVVYIRKPQEYCEVPTPEWLNCWLHNMEEFSAYDFSITESYVAKQRNQFTVKKIYTEFGVIFSVRYKYYWTQYLKHLLGIFDDKLIFGEDHNGKKIKISCFAGGVD
jgi:hypothetical protein